MLLERLLASQGFGTRRHCRLLIRNGRVAIGQILIEDANAEFEPDGLIFSVDGDEWLYRQYAYILLNKPSGYECSRKPAFHPSVYSLLPLQLLERGVQSVGRLDEDTTGLLLFSDDGQFIHTFTSPRKEITKVYEAVVKHEVGPTQVRDLVSGVILNGEARPIAAKTCEIAGERLIRLSVTEGKYHLVKRMIAAAGNRVVNLKRTRIGALELPVDLEEGQWCWLKKEDLALLAKNHD